MTFVKPAFRDELSFCSNMHPIVITDPKTQMRFKSVEHAYVYLLSADPGRDIVRDLPAGEAKRWGRMHARIESTPLERERLMARLLRAKFTARSMAEALLATGNDPLIEVNGWHDNFWGDCRCLKEGCDEPGLNRLGEMLMAIRSSL